MHQTHIRDSLWSRRRRVSQCQRHPRRGWLPATPGGARARVLFRVVFGDAVPSWLRGVIAAKTRGELALVYGAWEAETRRAVAGGAVAGPEPASPADEAYVFRPPSPVAAREDTLGLTDDQRAFVLRRSRP